MFWCGVRRGIISLAWPLASAACRFVLPDLSVSSGERSDRSETEATEAAGGVRRGGRGVGIGRERRGPGDGVEMVRGVYVSVEQRWKWGEHFTYIRVWAAGMQPLVCSSAVAC